jgi:hypothetical protein
MGTISRDRRNDLVASYVGLPGPVLFALRAVSLGLGTRLGQTRSCSHPLSGINRYLAATLVRLGHLFEDRSDLGSRLDIGPSSSCRRRIRCGCLIELGSFSAVAFPLLSIRRSGAVREVSARWCLVQARQTRRGGSASSRGRGVAREWQGQTVCCAHLWGAMNMSSRARTARTGCHCSSSK